MAKHAPKSKSPAKKGMKPSPAAKKPTAKSAPAAKRPKPVVTAKAPPAPVIKAASAVAKKLERPAPAGREAARREPIAAQQPAVAPVAPVPTNGKPRKNQAGLNAKDLEHFRDLLLAKRREIVGDMGQMEREALRGAGGSNLSNLPLHMADMGTDNYEQEFTLGLVEKDRNLLREINTALAKIMDGTYGLCEGTGKPISKVRLEAQPWARFSIEHARQMEKGFIR